MSVVTGVLHLLQVLVIMVLKQLRSVQLKQLVCPTMGTGDLRQLNDSIKIDLPIENSRS